MMPAHRAAREVLVVITGGTIGMAPGPLGLTPQEGRVERALHQLAHQALPIRIERFRPLVDSAHVEHIHWNRIIDHVASSPDAGIVVTHGTDTMAHTGAALAFALAGLDRTVVLCGAMRPLGTDGAAERNLALALATASDGPSGVWLAADGRLLAGHALVKRHSTAQRAFFEVEGSASPAPRRSNARRFADRRLAILTISPAMPSAVLRGALTELDGAILRVYGSGAAPADVAVIEVLRDAVARGVRIVAVSQCEVGGLVPGAYASGAPLWEAGVECGGAMTAEAALASLWLDLSDDNLVRLHKLQTGS